MSSPDEPDTATTSADLETTSLRADMHRSWLVIKSSPTLLAVTGLAGLSMWMSSAVPGRGLAAAVDIGLLGWVGSERLWFLRAYTGRSLRLVDALRASLLYWPRVVRLTILVGIALLPLGVPLIIAAKDAAARQPHALSHVTMPLWALLYFVVLSLFVDFALTFVMPALIYTNRNATSALRIGLKVLARTWPDSAPYVLVPPLAILIVARLAERTGWISGAILVAAYVVNLLAKGAAASYFLRTVRPIAPDGDVDIVIQG